MFVAVLMDNQREALEMTELYKKYSHVCQYYPMQLKYSGITFNKSTFDKALVN